jgi:hypothetical protein
MKIFSVSRVLCVLAFGALPACSTSNSAGTSLSSPTTTAQDDAGTHAASSSSGSSSGGSGDDDAATAHEAGNDLAAMGSDGAAAGHEICHQSWTVLTADPNGTYNFPQVGPRMLALDGAGNMVVAASFSGTVTVGGKTFQTAAAGDVSLLVVKLDPACRVLWAKAFGASQAAVQIAGVAVDATGNVVVGGTLSGPPVDFGPGPVGNASGSGPSALVFKLGAADGAGLWSHAYEASAGSFLISGYSAGVIDVAVDSRGNTVFVTGMGCPPRASCNQGSIDFGGGAVTFTWALVELDANGNFVFDADATFPGPSEYFTPYSLATGSAGRIWAAGFSDEFDILPFDASGKQQSVQKVTGAGHVSAGQATVRVDANDEVFAVAPSAQQPDGGTLVDTLLYKFSASGSPSWTPPAAIPNAATNTSWMGWPGGRLAVDSSGRALVTSAFAGSADFRSAGRLTSAGGIDSAVVRFDAQGHLIGGERWGGAEDDYPVDVAADAAGDAVIAGWSAPLLVGDDGGSASYAIFVAKLGW